jgi:hypothetical protein
MELSDENLLEEGPGADFQGATLQIHQDSFLCSRSPSSLEDEVYVAKLSESPDASRLLPVEREAGKRAGSMDENGLKPAVSSGVGVVSPIISIPKRSKDKVKVYSFDKIRSSVERFIARKYSQKTVTQYPNKNSVNFKIFYAPQDYLPSF